eukprot:2603472-Amphidinium_carterae.1
MVLVVGIGFSDVRIPEDIMSYTSFGTLRCISYPHSVLKYPTSCKHIGLEANSCRMGDTLTSLLRAGLETFEQI